MRDGHGESRAAVSDEDADLDTVGACAAHYADVVARHESAGTLASADAVLTARAELVECLLRTGWRPPPGAVRTLKQDRLLLRERDDRDLLGDERTVHRPF